MAQKRRTDRQGIHPRLPEKQVLERLASVPRRTERVGLRVSADEKVKLMKLAKHYGVTVTEMIVALVDVAGRDL